MEDIVFEKGILYTLLIYETPPLNVTPAPKDLVVQFTVLLDTLQQLKNGNLDLACSMKKYFIQEMAGEENPIRSKWKK